MVPWWVESRAEQLVLELRELLVRFDENLKANTLLRECVPHFLEDNHPAIALARDSQAAMIAHITGGPEAYAAYYSTNEHEQPFEQQYGIEATAAHKHLPRVSYLREALTKQRSLVLRDRATVPTLLDLSCNDGWMAANLRGLVTYHGIDLNPGCIERARDRKVPRAEFLCGDILWARSLTDEIRPAEGYDVVVCFECLEHVTEPRLVLQEIARVLRPGGRAFLSTPLGATEHGDLPQWWKIEPKGHVRVFTPRTFAELLLPWGTLEPIAIGPDEVMIGQLILGPADSRGRDADLPAQRADPLCADGTP